MSVQSETGGAKTKVRLSFSDQLRQVRRGGKVVDNKKFGKELEKTDTIMAQNRMKKRKITTHKAHDFDDAERWDLEFWQKQTPETRLSALMALRRDILKIKSSFKNVNWE